MDPKRIVRPLVAVVFLAAAAFGAVTLVRYSNGDFSGDYRLTGYFPQAGEGLQPGSEVVFRGVQVGRVSTISLAGTRAKVTLLMDPDFRAPVDTDATIAPINLFGAEQVTLLTPKATGSGADTEAGPYLAPTGTFTRTATSDELGDLFAAAAPLLNRVNTENLSAVVSDLAQTADGEGRRIARSIDAGASLAGFLNKTLSAQLAALDSFSQFTAAIAPDGTAINGISDQENAALPVFNKDVADYKQLLANLTSFSNELAQLLTAYHPDIATLLSQGDNVARVLLAEQTTIGQVIKGAYEYAYKVGESGASDKLPTGSQFLYFNTFILFTNVNTLVCDLLAPDQSGLSFLEPLQQALAGAGTPFDCQSQLAAFDAAQQSTATSAAPSAAPTASPASASPASTSRASASSPSGIGSVSRAAQSLANEAYGLAGEPTGTKSTSIGGYVKNLLGGGS
jgi:virulence factor Mce-like protein